MGYPKEVSEQSKLRLFFAVLGGAGLGTVLSFLVNSALVEISLNSFFSFYFGLLFLFVGSLILYRVKSHETFQKRVGMYVFGFLVVVSGLIAFLFEPHWMFDLSRASKVPLYSLLGMSISFALTFSVVDLFNFCGGQCYPNSPGIIETGSQINLLLAMSVIMGLGYGILFGALDVGGDVEKMKHPAAQLSRQMGHDELFCLPFGMHTAH
mmetsp:Transcript_19785/g.24121  ORF Transcript_19785/g.24121 Transcript_19785/m.24121 type:complete len:209 (+) Transcript_19785:362-988(+)